MAVQTTYADRMDAGRPGAIVNTEPQTLISRTVETADGIAFGAPAAQGSADKGIIATEAGVTAILGVVVRERSTNPETGGDKFAEKDSARLMTKGVIWVTAGEAVAAGDAAYVTVADGTFKKTATGNVAIPNARFDTSGASGALVQLRLA